MGHRSVVTTHLVHNTIHNTEDTRKRIIEIKTETYENQEIRKCIIQNVKQINYKIDKLQDTELHNTDLQNTCNYKLEKIQNSQIHKYTNNIILKMPNCI